MAIVNGYCTLEELQAWNTATSTPNIAIQERVVTASSRAIDQFCQRHFWQTAVGTIRTFPSPRDLRILRLGEFNDLVSIASLRTDEAGDGTFETVWSASDYDLLPLNPSGAPEQRPYTSLRATGVGRWFPTPTCTGRAARVEITGVWGWPAIPADVTQACLILAARFYKRKDSPDGISNWGDIGVIRVTRADPDVTALLDPYRRSAVLVA